MAIDISPRSIVKFRPGYTFYISPKKTPDKLMLDYLYCNGEFSIAADIAFEKHLKDIYNLKNHDHRTLPNLALV